MDKLSAQLLVQFTGNTMHLNRPPKVCHKDILPKYTSYLQSRE